MPKLVVVPKVTPDQGKGKQDKILHNGKSGGSIEAQIFGRRGALQNKTIVGKSLDRDQKRTVGLNAGLGTALSAGAVKRSVDYGRSSGKLKRMAKITEAGSEKTQLVQDAKYLRKMSGRNAAVVGASAGISAGLSAGIMSGQNALRERRYRKQAGVAKGMSDAELKRRRNLQSKVAITTSTLGLGALGIKGGSGVARKAGHLVRADKLSNLANTVALTSGGIGGAGGYNYAAITRAEAKKRPVSKAFSAESNRHRRSEIGSDAARYGGVAAGLGAGYQGGVAIRARGQARQAKRESTKQVQDGFYFKDKKSNMIVRSARPVRAADSSKNKPFYRFPNKGEGLNSAKKIKALKGVQHKATKTGLGLAGLGIAGVVASDRIESYGHRSGRSYSPRYHRPE